VSEPAAADLLAAARVLAAQGLVTAFGHVSVRLAPGRVLITPAAPLGALGDDGARLRELPLEARELPPGVPGEAWMHLAVYAARPDVRAVCRAQPLMATALGAAKVPIRALHGQGAFLGPEVPVLDDAVLVRDRERGTAVADRLGGAPGLLLRGNGALTVGASAGEAVARMWVLEASAELNATAMAAAPRGRAPQPLAAAELLAWEAVAPELLARIWDWLRAAP
jgi:HCOMODA/2-hydroxy-3-carboxy-muconic semialdehyde decarboxylase